MALADMFSGKVQEHEYAQIVAKETVPAVYVDGVPTSWRTDLYTAKIKEQRFRFEGLSSAEAHSTEAVTVTDVDGRSYTFTPVGFISDGSAGNAVFERESVDVTRGHMSPHMWWLEVVRRGAALYCNGVLVIGAPDWA